MADAKPIILLVEDNEEDAFLLERALRIAAIECDLRRARDGQEALDYLSGEGDFVNRDEHPAPCLMLLDLKLPYVNGIEVLEWLVAQPTGRDLRVIVLTSSDEDRDRQRVTQLGFGLYFVKPPASDFTTAVTKALQEIFAASAK